jgi:hypothetical protein
MRPQALRRARRAGLTPTQRRFDQTVEDVIADRGGDAREAVAELLAIIRCLSHKNQARREAASPGFARHRPIVFGRPK